MYSLNRSFLTLGLAILGSLAVASSASAQSLNTYVQVGAGNLAADGSIPIWRFNQNSSGIGAAVTASGSGSFSGLDSQGNAQTMTFSGSAAGKAEYGRLHSSARGIITNPYYNASNAPYYLGGDAPNPNGSAQYLHAASQSQFNDTLYLNPFADNGVTIRYVFHLDGVISPDHAYAYINFSAAGNNFLEFTESASTTFATPSWAVNSSLPIDLSTELGAVIGGNTNDPGTPEGVTGEGLADYYNTLTLESIQLLDADGNQVNGVEYRTASGTRYNLLGGIYSPVPAPSSFAIFAVAGLTGAFGILKRRRMGR